MILAVCNNGLIQTKRGTTRGRPQGDYLYHQGLAVHRLVATIFKPEGYHGLWMERVDHIDRDPHNNRADNLRWSNPVLNGLNSSRAGRYIKRAKCYLVQIRVMGARHACSVHTAQDAIYLVHHCNRTTFANLECLYKFLAAGDACPGGGTGTCHEWLRTKFPASFLRRLSGLPPKVRCGRRRTIT